MSKYLTVWKNLLLGSCILRVQSILEKSYPAGVTPVERDSALNYFALETGRKMQVHQNRGSMCSWVAFMHGI